MTSHFLHPVCGRHFCQTVFYCELCEKWRGTIFKLNALSLAHRMPEPEGCCGETRCRGDVQDFCSWVARFTAQPAPTVCETFLAWVCSWKSKYWDDVLVTYIVQPSTIVCVSICRDLLVGWLAGPEAVNPSQPSRDTTVGPSASQHHPLQQDGLSLVHKTFVRKIAN